MADKSVSLLTIGAFLLIIAGILTFLMGLNLFIDSVNSAPGVLYLAGFDFKDLSLFLILGSLMTIISGAILSTGLKSVKKIWSIIGIIFSLFSMVGFYTLPILLILPIISLIGGILCLL
ncbi:MAG: hypothetical protein KGI06_04685 [Candidatus Micrarchaeota archaeon]|nr:hypothetical protein [Candidatus Micrarchaeota archaeon]